MAAVMTPIEDPVVVFQAMLDKYAETVNRYERGKLGMWVKDPKLHFNALSFITGFKALILMEQGDPALHRALMTTYNDHAGPAVAWLTAVEPAYQQRPLLMLREPDGRAKVLQVLAIKNANSCA